MQKKSEDFSIKDAQRLKEHPALPQLLEVLRQADSSALADAVALAATGDYGKAVSLLQPLLAEGDAAKLLAQLGGSTDG